MTPPVPPEAILRYVLIGWPLRSSVSPAMHDAAFSALGIDARYELLRTAPEGLRSAVDEIRSGAIAGANVTIPHKIAARDWLDEESAAAARIGAVNTIVRTDRGLRGENTDAAGFDCALEAVGLAPAGGTTAVPNTADDTAPASTNATAPANSAVTSALTRDRSGFAGSPPSAVVLGAGGAARAVVDVLLASGWDTAVLSREASAGALLLRQMQPHYPDARVSHGPLAGAEVVRRAASATLLVNATPIGDSSSGGECPWPEGEPIPDSLSVIDLVAWPPRTRLVARAQAAGAQAVGGLPMLIGQAAASFELWTGQTAPRSEMARAAESAVAGASHDTKQESAP